MSAQSFAKTKGKKYPNDCRIEEWEGGGESLNALTGLWQMLRQFASPLTPFNTQNWHLENKLWKCKASTFIPTDIHQRWLGRQPVVLSSKVWSLWINMEQVLSYEYFVYFLGKIWRATREKMIKTEWIQIILHSILIFITLNVNYFIVHHSMTICITYKNWVG